MKNNKTVILVFAVILGLLSGVSYSDTTDKDQIHVVAGISTEDARAFYATLKKAILAGDKEQVAKMIRYPVGADIKGKHTAIKTKDGFLKHYSEIIDTHMVALVTKTSFEDLKPNWRGLFVGKGQIIFGGIGDTKKYKVLITVFNNKLK